MKSPVRLGVSPAAASTPTGVFNQRFEALFPHAGALGCVVCFAPMPQTSGFIYARMWGHGGLLAAAWPPLFHNLPPCWVCQPPPCRESSPPQLPVSAPPTSLDECFFLSPLLLDFHTVRFSVSSGCFLFLNCCCLSFGCVRRHSVSTYPSISVSYTHLTLPTIHVLCRSRWSPYH